LEQVPVDQESKNKLEGYFNKLSADSETNIQKDPGYNQCIDGLNFYDSHNKEVIFMNRRVHPDADSKSDYMMTKTAKPDGIHKDFRAFSRSKEKTVPTWSV
jgi:hypothetical protein